VGQASERAVLTLIPVRSAVRSARFDLVEFVDRRAGENLRDGDVIVVSSKFVAMSEGRVVELNSVHAGMMAHELGAKHHMDPRLCELVLRESDGIIGGIPSFLLASKDGLLTPNAGIDKSNVKHGMVVLYPRRPDESAKRVREALRFLRGISVAVVVCDSRLSPTRRGTMGVAVAASGLEAVLDMRGRSDLFGNVLKVTSQALADDLASAAEVLMGESDEATPMVIVRGIDRRLLGSQEYDGARFAISTEDDVFLRSLGHSPSTYA
jgi:coenzyme F420-0:L-glutamate ligase / coenzyme F420-1:gamma-L-glutamate ligase